MVVGLFLVSPEIERVFISSRSAAPATANVLNLVCGARRLWVPNAEHLVDAALAGMDRREEVTLPSVHDEGLWTAYDTARAQLFGGTQNGSPAPRYL